ncbi:hypothetical protein [Streptomyces fumanus]|uniref:Uncharacterized protein n=1 Tax=Streptomyces fumanus TaxID=67302 RepID=A0A919A2V1_9ACTN|nr:hypothetical protein [Streptomyces fumanus]GHE84850.1 hypothetical protein GCM10018772_04950 [Streptomyces fumanus]
MSDQPYTDDDLRAEAARQLSAHGPGASREQTYAAMLDAPIESTRDTDGPTWSEALDAPDLSTPAATINALINDAADVSEWAVHLGADGLEPLGEQLTAHTQNGPWFRLHFAVRPDMPDDMRRALVEGIGQEIAKHFPTA